MALQALEFNRDSVFIETPTIYFMQIDVVRLFYYLENRLIAKVNSYERKKLFSDQELLYERVRKFLIDDIFYWSWAYAKVPIEVEQSGGTPVLALTCGHSAHSALYELRVLALQDDTAKTKMLLTTMKEALRNQGVGGRLLRKDLETLLDGL